MIVANKSIKWQKYTFFSEHWFFFFFFGGKKKTLGKIKDNFSAFQYFSQNVLNLALSWDIGFFC